MRRTLLLTLFALLGACQALPPTTGNQPAPDGTPSRETIDQARPEQITDGPLRTPYRAGDPLPELAQWLHYQIHTSALPRATLEQQWLQLERQRQRQDNPYVRLQYVVVNLHYPARRNLNQLFTLLQGLEQDRGLNEDSRQFARQLTLWTGQLLRKEADIAQLNRQLETEKILKQELEEKIRKLSDIEETLNQRQRNREP